MKFLENSKNFIDENTVFLTCFFFENRSKTTSKTSVEILGKYKSLKDLTGFIINS